MPPKKPKKTDTRRIQSSTGVKRTEVAVATGISFSFRYFKDDNDKFFVGGRDATYLQALLARWRDLSTLTFQELMIASNNENEPDSCPAN